MSKYTAGPWEAHKTKKGYAILHPLINKDGEYKGKLGGYHVVVQERQLSPEGIETKLEQANARLIAQSPTMYEAAKGLLSELDNPVPDFVMVKKYKDDLRNAIAKVEQP